MQRCIAIVINKCVIESSLENKYVSSENRTRVIYLARLTDRNRHFAHLAGFRDSTSTIIAVFPSELRSFTSTSSNTSTRKYRIYTKGDQIRFVINRYLFINIIYSIDDCKE
jgi:hypothetical protein